MQQIRFAGPLLQSNQDKVLGHAEPSLKNATDFFLFRPHHHNCTPQNCYTRTQKQTTITKRHKHRHLTHPARHDRRFASRTCSRTSDGRSTATTCVLGRAVCGCLCRRSIAVPLPLTAVRESFHTGADSSVFRAPIH